MSWRISQPQKFNPRSMFCPKCDSPLFYGEIEGSFGRGRVQIWHCFGCGTDYHRYKYLFAIRQRLRELYEQVKAKKC